MHSGCEAKLIHVQQKPTNSCRMVRSDQVRRRMWMRYCFLSSGLQGRRQEAHSVLPLLMHSRTKPKYRRTLSYRLSSRRDKLILEQFRRTPVSTSSTSLPLRNHTLSLPAAVAASCVVARPCICQGSIRHRVITWKRHPLSGSYLLSSMRMVSIVFSLFHCAIHGSFEASTWLYRWLMARLDCVDFYLAIPLIHARQIDL